MDKVQPPAILDDVLLHAEKYGVGFQANGCLEVPNLPPPNIKNDIHPAFHLNRWMTGHDQHTSTIYGRMMPALQLASLFLSEECVLGHFAHMYLGSLRQDSRGIHIEPVPEENTPQGRQFAKNKLVELANVITFMFVPRDHYQHAERDEKHAWGITRASRKYFQRTTRFGRRYKESDFPPVPPQYRTSQYEYQTPIISLREDFQDFFLRDYPGCTPSQKYRVWLLFAVVLVHEVSHSFWMFLGRMKGIGEPYGYSDSNMPELGFDWEQRALGHVVDPRFGTVHVASNLPLTTKRTATWNSDSNGENRRKAMRILFGHELYRMFPWTANIEYNGKFSWAPEYELSDFPEPFGGQTSRQNFGFLITALSMRWVVAWFKEEHWDHFRDRWRRERRYEPLKFWSVMCVYYQRLDGKVTITHACVKPEHGL